MKAYGNRVRWPVAVAFWECCGSWERIWAGSLIMA